MSMLQGMGFPGQAEVIAARPGNPGEPGASAPAEDLKVKDPFAEFDFANSELREEHIEELRLSTLSMMEKLNVLTAYVLDNPADQVAIRQLTDIDSRLKRLSEEVLK